MYRATVWSEEGDVLIEGTFPNRYDLVKKATGLAVGKYGFQVLDGKGKELMCKNTWKVHKHILIKNLKTLP